MKKFNITLFSVFALGLTSYAMLWPNYYIQLLVSPRLSFAAIRILASALLAAYVFLPQARTYFARSLLRAFGITMLLMGINTFASPTFFGYSTGYVPIGDTLIFLEGGILSMVLSLELPAYQGTLISRISDNLRYRYFAVLLATQPNKILKQVPKTS